jgi:DNA-binding beta-propeller fold protein YncE
MELSPMNKPLASCVPVYLAVGLLACAALMAQQIPGATELPSHPFFIKKTWPIGGEGSWDYLSLDSAASQLFIAHGAKVQVVNVESGALAGEVAGLSQVHSIALDETGQFGYISDGPLDQVTVFDRRSFQRVVDIHTDINPRALAFEPQTKLLFVVRTDPPGENPGLPRIRPNTQAAAPRNPSPARRDVPVDPNAASSVTVIDTETQTAIGEILLPGKLGFAQADGNGQVYISITDRSQVLRLDAQAIALLLKKDPGSTAASQPQTGRPDTAHASAAWTRLDWSGNGRSSRAPDGVMRSFSLLPACTDPRSLAIDWPHTRLFVGCNNMKLVVLNAGTGEVVTSLPTGPGTDAIGFDANHGLIYSANGGANGSLTIIRQDVADSYAVVQVLPTRQRARTMAVNPVSGEVYLVTDLLGVNLAQPGGIGTLKSGPASGSFQVLVIGN